MKQVQAYLRLNNDILDSGLTVNELKVAVCLYSSVYHNNFSVQIKQKTIAKKCGFKQEKTVSDIICRLQRKGIIECITRPHKSNGWLGTYIYRLKAVVKKGYFKIKRHIINTFTGVQLRMYLFICRAVTQKNDMWNSFNDISRALQIARTKVIQTINELIQLGVIKKLKIIKKDGSYSDNHYSIADDETIKKENPEQSPKLSEAIHKRFSTCYYYIPVCAFCQHRLKQNISIGFYFFRGVVP